jgi:hypothetical protein
MSGCNEKDECTCVQYKERYWELRKSHIKFKEFVFHMIALVCVFTSLCFWLGYWWAKGAV